MIAPSSEVKAGQVVTRKFASEDAVIYRTQSGYVRAIRPYCPHLGAHLGYGGRVNGECIVCPFHGFSFAMDGSVSRPGIGYDGHLTKGLTTLPVKEVNGGIWAWHGRAGVQPLWDPPSVIGNSDRIHFIRSEIHSHPQELAENFVDLGHVINLHGYTQKEVELRFDDHKIELSVEIERAIPPFRAVNVKARATLHGIGMWHLQFFAPIRGVEINVIGSPRPIGPWRTELFIGASTNIEEESGKLLGILPKGAIRLMADIISWANLYGIARDLNADLPIWNSKRYSAPPRLAKGDGPIGPYRKWAHQFYSSELNQESRFRET
ncbi:Rieske 2Fe-2S domain-containing protein [Streptomyces sp. NRRL F-2664]|uniref:Rieske 2Fe-2S domain-containing protein n=1 Tax=Streptomyces sp. NRRL F-2664 TaxID=1463842 RepID=UPI0022771082|nr:Rieske 2Fe-2S domain-containing protein [Streptomyces sp. NRRL F-2664]